MKKIKMKMLINKHKMSNIFKDKMKYKKIEQKPVIKFKIWNKNFIQNRISHNNNFNTILIIVNNKDLMKFKSKKENTKKIKPIIKFKRTKHLHLISKKNNKNRNRIIRFMKI